MDLWKAIRVIRHRKWTFLLVSLVMFGVALLMPRRQPPAPPPIYTSTGKVLITPQNLDASVDSRFAMANMSTTPLTAWFADEVTLRELLTSEGLLQRVGKKLSMGEHWVALRGRVEVKAVSARSLNIFTISVVAPKAEEAQRTADALIAEFSGYVQDLSSKEFAATRRKLEEQITLSNARIKKLQAEMEQASVGLPSQEDLDEQSRRRAQLEGENASLGQEISSLQEELGQLQDFIAGRIKTPPWQVLVQKDSALNALGETLSHERLTLLELEKTFTEGDEQIVRQRKRVADLEELYLKQTAAAVQSLAGDKSRQLTEKTGRLHSNEERLKAMKATRVPDSARFKLDRIKRQLAVDQEGYIEEVRQLNRARVSELTSRRQGAITVLERPLPGIARNVVMPRARAWTELLLAVPLCLLLGAGAALLAEHLQSSLRLRPRIEAAMDLPVLAVIPQLNGDVTRSWDKIKQ